MGRNYIYFFIFYLEILIMADTQTNGRIYQIIGPVIDVRFEGDNLPQIYNSIEIEAEDRIVIGEVQQMIGSNVVRAISMTATEGLSRNLPVKDNGQAISVPVGQQVLGRIFNVLGEPIDQLGDVPEPTLTSPIHRAAPSFYELVGTSSFIFFSPCDVYTPRGNGRPEA